MRPITLANFTAVAGLALLLSTASCTKPETLRYPHGTAETTAQAWADAFNRNEVAQLRLLVHPDRRALFDEHSADLAGQLKAFDVQRWVMGATVVVGDKKLEGREIMLFFTDTTTVRENSALIVFSEGHWWLWKY